MTQDRRLNIQKVGMVRIYLSAKDRRPGGKWKQLLLGRPLYQEIIDLASEAGLWAATAKAASYGFTHHGQTKADFHPEVGPTNTHIFVELIAPRAKLELFTESIHELISGRVVTFTEAEHWGIDG